MYSARALLEPWKGEHVLLIFLSPLKSRVKTYLPSFKSSELARVAVTTQLPPEEQEYW